MLFQEGGDALVMAGDFQAEFCHGVPARSTWKDLKSLPMFATMQDWEKVGLQQEIALHEGAEPEAKHVRMNCTVRWHSTHWAGCPVRGQEGHGTQPVSTGAVQTSSSSLAPGEDTVNVSAGAAASTQGTQPVVTGAVRVPAASVVDPKQSLLFTGIKKRGVEEEATPSVSTVKTSRSGEELLLERSDETIKSLLDCIEACVRQNDLFTLAITGKTTIILELMLDVFCRFFPARPGEEERYMTATFSHAQSDAISNDVYRARTCHTACSYRVASLRNKHLALKTKEQEMKQRWQPKILVIQDEISLVPAAVENMMLYRSMRARQDEGLDPASYFHPGELMGHIPILLIAGDFLQIKPANEISLADNLEELIRKMPHRVQTEHHAAQAALMTIDTVIHLKKSKRFLDAHLPEITTAMRTCTPAAPLSEDHLAQLRTRKIENCKKELTTDLFKHGHVIGMYWENIARSMVERANRDAQDLDVPLFCLQAADQRHSRKNKAIDKQLTHQLLTVPNPHRTGKLQGMLLVHENMVVRLADVLAPHLGLVKDKLAVVVKVDLHHEDQKRLDRREPGFCLFFPDYMAKGIWVKLLKGKNSPMEEALLQTWEEKFQNVADHTTDAKTLFFVELVHAEFKIDLKLGEETEKIEVIRWQFPLLHGMLRTAYSAQGLTLDGGVLVDLRRGGGLEDADWWLAIYVMLTRARKLKNLILLGFTEQVEELLRRGPPTYLRELTDKLETKAASTLERLQSWPVYDALQASWHSALPVGPNRFWLKRSGGGIGLTRCSTCGT